MKKITLLLLSVFFAINVSAAPNCVWTDDPKGPICSIVPQKSGLRLGTANHPFGNLHVSNILPGTVITATGTTGAQTINAAAGTVNIAASAASVVVTNSLVTTSSVIFTTIRRADATLTFIKSAVPASGSFTITGNANATAETSVGFLVIN